VLCVLYYIFMHQWLMWLYRSYSWTFNYGGKFRTLWLCAIRSYSLPQVYIPDRLINIFYRTLHFVTKRKIIRRYTLTDHLYTKFMIKTVNKGRGWIKQQPNGLLSHDNLNFIASLFLISSVSCELAHFLVHSIVFISECILTCGKTFSRLVWFWNAF